MAAWWDREDMPSVEERLAYLEGRMGDQTMVLTGVRADVQQVQSEVHDVRSEVHQVRSEVHQVRSEVHQVRSEVHQLRTETNAQFASLRTAVDARFVAMDGKFTWLIGIQVAMILMFAGAFLSAFLK